MIFFKLSAYNGGIIRASAISVSIRENMCSLSSNDSNPCCRALGSAGHDIPVTIKYVIAKGPVDGLFNIGCHKTMHCSQLLPDTCLIRHEPLQGDRLCWSQWNAKQTGHFLPNLFPAKKITIGYFVGPASAEPV
jgi:hypothetical protein